MLRSKSEIQLGILGSDIKYHTPSLFVVCTFFTVQEKRRDVKYSFHLLLQVFLGALWDNK
jgi:hypothetical protein